jgi:N-glycosylase/DNA lyase
MAATVPAGFHALPLPKAQLCLAAVLRCGQSFRWSSFPLDNTLDTTDDSSAPTHEYRLCLPDRVVCLRQSSSTLFYRSVFPAISLPSQEAVRHEETLQWLNDYFQLDIDLLKLYDSWSDKDPVFRTFRPRFVGIRVLRQNPWENLVSCVCSATPSYFIRHN